MTAGITPRFAITTPELVTFHYRPAEIPTRALAWLIDQVAVMLLRIVSVLVLANLGEPGIAVWLVVLLALDFGYFTVMEWRGGGQTPGKRVMKIRVATVTGARLEGGDVLMRNLLRVIDSLPFTMAVGGTVAWLDPHRRRLGDLVAGTIVIRDTKAELPEAVFDAARRVNVFRSHPTTRARILGRITRQERDLLMDLVQRRDQLDNLHRESLFKQAAVYFRKRLNLEESEHLTDEQAVLNVALVVRDPRASKK